MCSHCIFEVIHHALAALPVIGPAVLCAMAVLRGR